jgi:sugar phosphate isomerase/epimerase
LSGFGDEIAADLEEQLDLLASEGIDLLDLRAVWERNVLTLSDAEVETIWRALVRHDMRVACIGSPIGKVAIDSDFEAHLADFRRILAIASQLNAPYVRVFSFFLPPGDDPAIHRQAVLDRLGALITAADGAGVTLLHENELGIYGDTPERCLDLHETLASPAFGAIWDPGNFASNGLQSLYALPAMLPYIRVVHVKDVVMATGQVVVAGAGDARWPETIAALHTGGFNGILSLEPHLTEAGRFGGFSGPGPFRDAARALKGLLAEQGYRGDEGSGPSYEPC